MSVINTNIPDELDKKLRIKAAERFGGKKGSLTKAIVEAIEDWLSK